MLQELKLLVEVAAQARELFRIAQVRRLDDLVERGGMRQIRGLVARPGAVRPLMGHPAGIAVAAHVGHVHVDRVHRAVEGEAHRRAEAADAVRVFEVGVGRIVANGTDGTGRRLVGIGAVALVVETVLAVRVGIGVVGVGLETFLVSQIEVGDQAARKTGKPGLIAGGRGKLAQVVAGALLNHLAP